MRTIVKQEIFYKTLSCSVYHFRKSQYLKTSVLSIDLLRMCIKEAETFLSAPFTWLSEGSQILDYMEFAMLF